jgi:ribosomal protein S16
MQTKMHQNYKILQQKSEAKSRDCVWEQVGQWDPRTEDAAFINNELARLAKERLTEGCISSQ